MRVLLDANVPTRFKLRLVGHAVSTARERRLNHLPDGRLLDAMADQFDALVTLDKSLPFQQRLSGRSFAVIVLRARSNRIADLLPLIPGVLDALKDIRPGECREVAGI